MLASRRFSLKALVEVEGGTVSYASDSCVRCYLGMLLRVRARDRSSLPCRRPRPRPRLASLPLISYISLHPSANGGAGSLTGEGGGRSRDFMGLACVHLGVAHRLLCTFVHVWLRCCQPGIDVRPCHAGRLRGRGEEIQREAAHGHGVQDLLGRAGINSVAYLISFMSFSTPSCSHWTPD
jgi:hypothetical protein